ncbi:MAG: tRNA preQ1(34) S-adenosylmethionine ribosyltransferase-isomerase QueA [Bradymonadales bacterium]|nr:MAG: tRNA preQ1(34) S-adenosylmethionine ribosyltransferase-isomerase QueA [Bradymonadales bacterium]
MRLEDFDFDFPADLVATRPVEPPSDAKLLLFDRATHQLAQKKFMNLLDELTPQDLLVTNETKVIPARFLCEKESGAKFEGLFLGGFFSERAEPNHQQAMTRVWLQGKWRPGETLKLLEGPEIEILSRTGKEAILKIAPSVFESYLKDFGKTPLPPYIRAARKQRTESEDWELDPKAYQNPFACQETDLSSKASPTASLHCDDLFFEAFERRGLQRLSLELEIGLGTFAPIEVQELSSHRMHRERYRISSELWRRISETKAEGGRVVALGTTVLRALESRARLSELGDESAEAETDIFIFPPFDFRVVDALITNFHQPQSTLLLLVAAFLEPSSLCPKALWRKVYQEAISRGFRLFSYGDALFIR